MQLGPEQGLACLRRSHTPAAALRSCAHAARAAGSAVSEHRQAVVQHRPRRCALRRAVPCAEADTARAEGLSAGEAADRLARFGRNAVTDAELTTWQKLEVFFATPTAALLWFAIVVEAVQARSAHGADGFWADVAILLAVQCLNGALTWTEERRAAGAVAGLAGLLRPEALVRRDGQLRRVDAAFLVPGDRIALRGGAAVPADCLLQGGASLQVDASALTGESSPLALRPGDTARMGTTVLRGEGEAVVVATGAATSVGRTAALVAQPRRLGQLAGALGRVALVLTTASLFAAMLVFIHLWSRGDSVGHALAFALVLCCTGAPIAMRAVCSTTLARGARQLAGVGAVARKLAAVEELARMDMLCLDKTGTLTAARLTLTPEMPVFVPGLAASDLLTAAALATRWWEPPADALDALIIAAVDTRPLSEYTTVEFFPFDSTSRRSEATLQRRDGSLFKVAKGSPQVLLEMAANGDDVRSAVEGVVADAARRGVRCLGVSATNDAAGGWLLLGVLTFTDPLRHDAARTLASAGALGVEVKVLTGDHAAVAADALRRLGLRGQVGGPDILPRAADVTPAMAVNAGRDYGQLALDHRAFAGIAPEHKYILVEALRQDGYIVGFAGDGANDAPALARADCGIAVSGSTDAARAAAGLVLTSAGLSPLLGAVLIARAVFARLRVYAIYRIAATVQLLGFFFFACLTCNPYATDPAWPRYFALPVVALAVLTILTDATVVALAYDSAVAASASPERWRLTPLFAVGAAMGFVAAVSSGAVLTWGLQAAVDKGPLRDMLGGHHDIYPRLQTAVYLKLTLSNVLTVFSARTQSYCWTRMPPAGLVATVIFAACLTSALATNWPSGGGMEPISGSLALLIWFYALVTFAAQDALKVVAYTFLAEFGQGGLVVEVSPEAVAAMSRATPQEEEQELRDAARWKRADAAVVAGSTAAPRSAASSMDSADRFEGYTVDVVSGDAGGDAEADAEEPAKATPNNTSSTRRRSERGESRRRGGGGGSGGIERALAGGPGWGVLVEGAPWLRGYEAAMHEDYRTLVSVFDWAALLRGCARPGGGVRLLDVGSGCGSFPAALARAGGLDGLALTMDMLDPSEYALRVVAQRLQPPFAAGAAIHGRLQALEPDERGGSYDCAWAVHSLYTLPRAELGDALQRMLASVRPGGVLVVVQSARGGHVCRLHERMRAHAAASSSRRTHAQPLLAAEDVEDELRDAGVRFRTAEVGHSTAVPADAPQLLEAYLQGCAVACGAAEAPTLQELHAAPEVGQYIRAMRDWERTTYYFAQRVKIILVQN